jgi:hypothetical protein
VAIVRSLSERMDAIAVDAVLAAVAPLLAKG